MMRRKGIENRHGKYKQTHGAWRHTCNFQRTEDDGVGLVDELLASFLVLPQLRWRGDDFDVCALPEAIANLQTGRTRLPIDEDLFGGEQIHHASTGRCRRGGKRRDARRDSGHGREEGERRWR